MHVVVLSIIIVTLFVTAVVTSELLFLVMAMAWFSVEAIVRLLRRRIGPVW